MVNPNMNWDIIDYIFIFSVGRTSEKSSQFTHQPNKLLLDLREIFLMHASRAYVYYVNV